MSRSQSFLRVVFSAVVTVGAIGCSQAPGDATGSNAPDASQSVGASGAASGGESTTNGSPGSGVASGGATGPTGDGTGSGVATSSGSTAGAGTTVGASAGTVATTATLLPPAGTCPTGFVVCDGVCLEAALMGADCRPAACPAPPAGTVAPTRTSLSARGFDWTVALDATGTTTVTFKPGPAGGGLSATAGADLNYRVNGVPALQTASLTSQGAGVFTWTTQSLKQGDDLDFYFHQTVATQTLITGNGAPPATEPLIDTMWFHQTIGQPADPEPAYPLTVSLAGRFRDRHPNEERFDHFVDTYFDGPIFSLTILDYGNYLRVTIVPLDTHVYGVDFKTYECFGAGMGGGLPSPTPLCFTPPELSAEGVRINPTYPSGTSSATSSGVYTVQVGGQMSTVKPGDATLLIGQDLAYGQLLDFEDTFVRQPGPMNNRTYYTEMFMYYVGSGRFQPKVQHPWAHAAGDESITDVTVDQFGYAQHVPNISMTELSNLVAGKVLFEADFDSLVGYNPPTTFDCPRGGGGVDGLLPVTTVVPPLSQVSAQSPVFTTGTSFTNMALAAAQRPGYTSSSCFSCHHLDGKGPPPGAALPSESGLANQNGMGAALLKLFTASADGKSAGADPTYGTILDQRAPKGTTPEVQASVTWQSIAGQFADGTPYTLRKPVLSTASLRDGALSTSTHISMRIPRPVFGLGFLEAIDDATIMANADPNDANGDGISGRPNMLVDPVSGAQVLGRFGWKAGTATLQEQAALAFVNDIGLTNPIFPQHRCGTTQTACLNAVNDATPELTATDLTHVESYLRGLSVPPRKNYDDPLAAQGQALFFGIGCVKCHVPNMVTSSSYPIAEMRNIAIQPFTDLLIHDLGPGLADDAPIEEGTATGSEWRTCPLWGNGTGASVMYLSESAFTPNDNPDSQHVYLHDGRAQSITEAILWHGGEAASAQALFVKMPAADRAALLAYVAYPFADPVPLRHCATSSPQQ
jgi:CxxC motif-containing protein (DUF1111 family)